LGDHLDVLLGLQHCGETVASESLIVRNQDSDQGELWLGSRAQTRNP